MQPVAATIVTSVTGVVSAFAAALIDFPVNEDRSTDSYVQSVFDAIAKILYSLEYDTVGGVHNLVGLIQDPVSYHSMYG